MAVTFFQLIFFFIFGTYKDYHLAITINKKNDLASAAFALKRPPTWRNLKKIPNSLLSIQDKQYSSLTILFFSTKTCLFLTDVVFTIYYHPKTVKFSNSQQLHNGSIKAWCSS